MILESTKMASTSLIVITGQRHSEIQSLYIHKLSSQEQDQIDFGRQQKSRTVS